MKKSLKTLVACLAFMLPSSYLTAETFETVDQEVVIEAEDYTATSGSSCSWNKVDEHMRSSIDDPSTLKFNKNICRMDYEIDFKDTGRYHVHLRTRADDDTQNGFFATLDGKQINYGGTNDKTGLEAYYIYVAKKGNWYWLTDGGGTNGRGLKISLNVDQPGPHTFSLYRRDKGSRVDRIWLTQKQSNIQQAETLSLPDPKNFITGKPPGGENPGRKKIQPTADAYLHGATRHNNEQLRIDKKKGRVAYLRFDTSDISSQDINRAVLKLRVRKDTGSGPMSVYLGDSNKWNDSNLNPSNAPRPVGSAIARKNENYRLDTWYEFDVTNAVSGGGMVSFILQKETDANDVAFGSKECAGYSPELVIESASVSTPDIVLTLVNADTDNDHSELSNGETLNLQSVGRQLNIRADVENGATPHKVEFFLDDDLFNTEKGQPHTLAGDAGGDYNPWTPAVGSHTLEVIAYNAKDKVIANRTLHFKVTNGGQRQFDPAKDLISLHFDNYGDADDGHALVADRTIVGTSGIKPHVVSGAYNHFEYKREECINSPPGTPPPWWDTGYYKASEKVLTVAYGKNGWLNAHKDYWGTARKTAAVWHKVLKNNGHIWIAEGGTSDFTYETLKHLVDKLGYPKKQTKQTIHLVQHGSDVPAIKGRQPLNECHTTTYKLKYVKANTDYVIIPSGNWGNNGTAHFSFKWNSGHQNKIKAFMASANRHPKFGKAWKAAFAYYHPNDKVPQTSPFPYRALDFSDTVELLHILGVGVSEVEDCTGFKEKYLD